jgi:dynein heavy chain
MKKRRALPGQNVNFTGPNSNTRRYVNNNSVPSIPQPQRRSQPDDLNNNSSTDPSRPRRPHTKEGALRSGRPINQRGPPRPSPRTEAIANQQQEQQQQKRRQQQQRRLDPKAPSTNVNRIYGRGQQWQAPPRRRTFQLLAAANDRKDNQHNQNTSEGGDDWFVDLSRRPPVFSDVRKDVNEDQYDDNSPQKTSRQAMNNVETTLGALRRNIIMGHDYPPVINKYCHTRAAAIVDETTRHPVPARIGGLFSSFVGTLHLDYKKSLYQQIKALRARTKKRSENSSKLEWVGLPKATAEPGPPIRTAPVVEMTLSIGEKKYRNKGNQNKKNPLLVYELLEEDGDVKRNASNARDGRISPATESMLKNNNNDQKYLYGLKPILSTNACGDGRIHSFNISSTQNIQKLNAPLMSTLEQRNGVSMLDTQSPSSPKQKPKFHYNDTNTGEIVTVVGINQTASPSHQQKNAIMITQNELKKTNYKAAMRDQKELNTKDYQRYWKYVHNLIPDNDIAPMNLQALLNVNDKLLNISLTPPGIRYQMGDSIIKHNKQDVENHKEAVEKGTEDEDSLIQGVHVSMISSISDLMNGSGEQLLIQSICRADGRFWSSFRTTFRNFNSDALNTINIDMTDEFAVEKKELTIKTRSSRIQLLAECINDQLDLNDIDMLTTTCMKMSMLEMKNSKNLLDIIQEMKNESGSKENNDDIRGINIPVDEEFINKYVRAEEWRFTQRLHEIVEHIESLFLLKTEKKNQDKNKKTMRKNMNKQDKNNKNDKNKHDSFTYPIPADDLPIIKARNIRISLLSIMIDISNDEYLQQQSKQATYTTDAEDACHRATVKILQTRIQIITKSLTYYQSMSSGYWTNILNDIYALYRNGIAQSIMNYVLLDDVQCQRISFLQGAPKNITLHGWGWKDKNSTKKEKNVIQITNDLKEYIHQSKYNISELPSGSVLNNALLVDFIALWERYDHLTLVDLPISDVNAQEMKWSPMNWSKFEKKQYQQMKETKNILLNEWYPKAQQILFDAAEEGLFDQINLEVLHHFLEACASILLHQLWSIIMKSARQYLSFFQRYNQCEANLNGLQSGYDHTVEHARALQRTGIYIHMTLKNDSICYAGEGNEYLNGINSNILHLYNKMIEYLIVPSNGSMSSTSSEVKKNMQDDTKMTDNSSSISSIAVGGSGEAGAGAASGDGAASGAGAAAVSVGAEEDGANDNNNDDTGYGHPSHNNTTTSDTILFSRPSYFLLKTKRLPSNLIPISKALINVDTVKEHIDLNQYRLQLENIIELNCMEAKRILTLYDRISELLIDPKEVANIEKMGKKGFGDNGSSPTVIEFQEKIQKYLQIVHELRLKYLNVIPCGLFLVQCKALNQRLIETSYQLCAKLLRTLSENTISRNIKLHKRFETIRSQSERVPSTSDELDELERYFDATLGRGGEVDQLKRSGLNLIVQTKFLIKNSVSIGYNKSTKDNSKAKEENNNSDTTDEAAAATLTSPTTTTTQITQYGCGFMMNESYLRPTGTTLDWLSQTDGIILAGKGRLRLERDRLESNLKRTREQFMKSLDVLFNQILDFKKMDNIQKVFEIEIIMNTMNEEIDNNKLKVIQFNQEESILGLAITQFHQMEEIKTTLAPFAKLWNLALISNKNISKWTEISCVYELNSEKIEKQLKTIIRTCSRLISTLSDIAENTCVVAENVINNCRDFLQKVPLISVLSNRGMRLRHWEQIDTIVGLQIRPDTTTTFERVSYMNKHIEKLQEIGDIASKEWAVEKMLNEMNESWTPIQYTFNSSFRDTGAAIVKGESIDIVSEILDEQIVKIQTLTSLPQAQYFIEEVNRQDEYLKTTLRISELIVKVQSAWMYLYPVFGSDDIKKALANESDAFANIDDEWRRITTRAQVHPQVTRVSSIENIVGRLEAMDLSLDSIQLGLKRYLEEKRNGFPRFYFLSDEELLEILAETRNPKKIQPFLRKIFEGIRTVKFQGSMDDPSNSLEIVAMQSNKSEEVWLSSPVDPMQYGSGACEKWLVELENKMRDTMKAELRVAIEQYDAHENSGYTIEERCEKREEWILNRPAQVVLGIDQLLWTNGAEKAMKNNGWKGLVEYANELEAMQLSIVRLVRGELSKVHRSTLGALLTLDVHCLTVIRDQLIAVKSGSVTNFEWQSQLRYYWEENGLIVKIMDVIMEYGNEYLGNSGRLVITPLTDRCYRTLMGALHLQYGGAPEGPAGTGKTETTKDLSKALGQQCIVFNCSDGLDAAAMSKFFKGLAAAGAWACFDEFNRIPIEVLSVIAQQVGSIQVAIAQRQQTLIFEGTTLKLNWRAAVFITMNPGYAGRAELPDNLKALFRPVAMMVPDYAMISEIILYSHGFSEGASLAVKIVATYRLCSELLSNQKHYDYGMRAVISVLTAAGNLRRKHPDMNEASTVLTAVNQVNRPKFLVDDLSLYSGIISDLFLNVLEPEQDNTLLLKAVDQCAQKKGLQQHPAFLNKVIELREMVLVRHGLMIVGDPLAGKTCCYRILQDALTLLNENGELPCELNPNSELKTDVFVINPKSISMGDLYGYNDMVSQEWSDGVLSKIYRHAAGCAATSDNRKWIVFDGPVDAVWIENMNTVLDDNKKLCLVSGEMLPMSQYMNMVFETLNLDQASPATVSRCGMVYMPVPDCTVSDILASSTDKAAEQGAAAAMQDATWVPHVRSWLDTMPSILSDNQNINDSIIALYKWVVPPMINLVTDDLRNEQMISCSGIALVHALNRMFGCVLQTHWEDDAAADKIEVMNDEDEDEDEDEEEEASKSTRNQKGKDGDDQENLSDEQIITLIDSMFLFSVVWSIGACLTKKGRDQFNIYFRTLCGGKDERYRTPRAFESKGSMIPTNGKNSSVFDYYLNIELLPTGGKRIQWVTWKEMIQAEMNAPISQEITNFDTIIVPTSEGTCIKELLDCLITWNQHPLLTGSGGTGKTAYMSDFIAERMFPKTKTNNADVGSGEKAEYFIKKMQFSTFTTPPDIQSNVLESMLQKKATRTITSKSSQKTLFVIDDINMPEKEQYGAQPPLELIRQGIDINGSKEWYDLEDKKPWRVETLQLMCAMGVPGGGRNALPVRLSRHFHLIGMVSPPSSTIASIFTKILQWHCTQQKFEASHPFYTSLETYVNATMDVYRSALDILKPTPTKSHYVFSTCDVRRVMQGSMLIRAKELPDGVTTTPGKVIRMWLHEVTRVFVDRVVDPKDLSLISECINTAVKKHYKRSLKDVIEKGRSEDQEENEEETKEGDSTGDGNKEKEKEEDAKEQSDMNESLTDIIQSNVFSTFRNMKARFYDEMPNIEKSTNAANNQLKEYNAMTEAPMSLILFQYAIAHLARIVRILLMKGGHGLLVGMGGSGRQSLTKLASHIARTQLVQFEISSGYGRLEWKEDLRQMLMKCGTTSEDDDGTTTFLLTDTQIIDDLFIADVNSLLSSGEVPMLFSPAERDMVSEKMRPIAISKGYDLISTSELFDYFIRTIKDRLHVVLCFSPVGALLRRAIRKMPSVISCCSLNWFTAWPKEALKSVSMSLLKDVPFQETETTTKTQNNGTSSTTIRTSSTEIRQKISYLCEQFFTDTCGISDRFTLETRRKQYVTPLSYLELLTTYKSLLETKREQILNEKRRYETGLEQLAKAEDAVSVMQEKLEKIRPVLIETKKDAEDMMVLVQQETVFAIKIREGVEAEKSAAQGKADLANNIKKECQIELDKAMPAMNAAINALQNLKKDDITEMKSFKSPPGGVRLIAEVLCHMFQIKPQKVKDPNDPSKKINDYWSTAKSSLLTGTDFLQRLFDYDKDNIPNSLVRKVKPYLAKPEFEPKAMQRSSTAGYGISVWVRAIIQYDIAAKIVGPKKAASAKATAEYEVIMEGVQEKEKELKVINDKLSALEEKQQAAQSRKEQLEKDVEMTGIKISRAKQLVDGLGGEKKRWSEVAILLFEEYKCLAGDVLLSSAQISFLGVFSTLYRSEAVMKWRQQIQQTQGLLISEKCSLSTTLGDPVMIRQWNLQGLPVDQFSIENGIITDVTKRFPLFIDPQGQANKWIRNKESDNALEILTMNDTNYLRKLKTCIRFGQPVLMEGLNEKLEMALDPLLTKALTKKGNTYYLYLDGESIEYSPKFTLYMTTNLANPHYMPETSVKVTLINFMITEEGLREQILGKTVSYEKPELEKMKNKLIVESAENTRKLKELENKILHVLMSSKGSILDDETAVNVLTSSKKLSNEITQKQKAAKETEIEIDNARQVYVPVSRCATSMFMTITQLEKIDPMYQYSLDWYLILFEASILNSRKTSKKKNQQNAVAGTSPLVNEISRCVPEAERAMERILTLNNTFAENVYKNVCRSLFERHKLLFSLMMTIELMNCSAPHSANVINQYLRFLMTGGTSTIKEKNQCEEWLDNTAWCEICRLSILATQLTKTQSQMQQTTIDNTSTDSTTRSQHESSHNELQYLKIKVMQSPQLWKAFATAVDPSVLPIPGDWTTPLTTLQEMCIVRCFRKDAVLPCTKNFVKEYMSKSFLNPPPFNLSEAFVDSSQSIPLVFILSTGSDPMDSVFHLGRTMDMNISTVSLGQGQNTKAERLLKKCTMNGSWLVLQNCHLYPSWMSTLDQLFKDVQRRSVRSNLLEGETLVEESFRLWLTSKPSSFFPVSVLQSSVKLTKEPPSGLRSNIRSSMNNDIVTEACFYDGVLKGPAAIAWKKLLFRYVTFLITYTL